MTDGHLPVDDEKAVPVTPQQSNRKPLADGDSGDSDGQPGNVFARVARQQRTLHGRNHLFSAEPPNSQGANNKGALANGTPTASRSKGAKSSGAESVKVSVGPQTSRESQMAAEADAVPAKFMAAKRFQGPKTGYWFGKGNKGLKYYREAGNGSQATEEKAAAREGENPKNSQKQQKLMRLTWRYRVLMWTREMKIWKRTLTCRSQKVRSLSSYVMLSMR